MVSLSKIIGVTRKPAIPSDDHISDGPDTAGFVDDVVNTVSADRSSIPLTAAVQENEETLLLSSTDEPQSDEGQTWSPNPSAEWSHNYEEDIVEEDEPKSRWIDRVFPLFFSALMIAWTGFFLWSVRAELLSGLGSAQTIQMLGAWSLPASLIGVAWLLMLRNSHSEARRFAKTGLSLRQEGLALQERVRNINEEIAMARDFLSQHGKDLEIVGRLSSTRMVEASNLLTAALHDSEEKAKALEVVSSAATGNLEQLRKHLPVVTSAAKDVTNQIGVAGHTAQAQVESLIAALQQAESAGAQAHDNIEKIESKAAQIADTLSTNVKNASQNFADSTEFAAVKSHEISDVIDGLTRKLSDTVNASTAAIGTLVDSSNDKLNGQITNMQAAVSFMAQATNKQDDRISRIVANLQSNIEQCGQKIAEIDAMATERSTTLAFSLETLAVSSHDLNSSLAQNTKGVETLLSTSERLLLALDTSSREIEETLPAALSRIDAHFERSLQLLATAREQTEAVENHGAQMLAKSDALLSTANQHRTQLESLLTDSDAQFLLRSEQAETLAVSLRSTQELLSELANGAGNDLVQALQAVQHETQQAADASKQILDTELASVSEKMAEQSRNLLADAVNAQVSSLNLMIQEAIGNNITASEATTESLVSKLQQIESMTQNLENRIRENRDNFEGLDSDGFARRMALLTESLNSTAIDVAKILSNEVTDTAWASYLKGDRGVFTRRAVKLLDAGEARAIATHYGEDPEFREHVNRYIHDFESMMRVLLSTRDGNAIGVTLLSSDVGKLYVALAQAIERLRN
jgi:hypothetical protein